MKLTYFPSNLNILTQLLLIDAKNKKLGKLATLISLIVQGKHLLTYNNASIRKNNIIVINASNIIISKRKLITKVYYKHSNFIGGLKKENMKDLFLKTPSKLLKYSILKMLPKNLSRDKLMQNIKIYPDTNHPYNLVPIKQIN